MLEICYGIQIYFRTSLSTKNILYTATSKHIFNELDETQIQRTFLLTGIWKAFSLSNIRITRYGCIVKVQKETITAESIIVSSKSFKTIFDTQAVISVANLRQVRMNMSKRQHKFWEK